MPTRNSCSFTDEEGEGFTHFHRGTFSYVAHCFIPFIPMFGANTVPRVLPGSRKERPFRPCNSNLQKVFGKIWGIITY